MAMTNEELMRAFVRTGRIMQHLDGGGRCDHRWHGHGHGGPSEGFPTEGDPAGAPPEFAPGEGEPMGDGFGPGCHHGHGPHGHGADHHGDHGPHGNHGPHGRGLAGRHGQVRALSLIAMQEGITQKDLAFLLGIRPQSAGEMLQKLEGYGLVERRKSEADARAIELYLTEDGRAHAAEIDRMRAVVAEDVFSVLTDDEKAQLATILGKLQAELDKHRPRRHGARESAEDKAEQE